MSTFLSTYLTIHAATKAKQKLIADLLKCLDFSYPDISDIGEDELYLEQEGCGYEENLLPAVNMIRQMFIRKGVSDVDYSIDGYTDCDYGVYCFFEISYRNTVSYCRDIDLDTTEFDPEEGFDPEDVWEARERSLSTCPWDKLDNHWAVKNPVRDSFDEDALQKAEDVINIYLSSSMH